MTKTKEQKKQHFSSCFTLLSTIYFFLFIRKTERVRETEAETAGFSIHCFIPQMPPQQPGMSQAEARRLHVGGRDPSSSNMIFFTIFLERQYPILFIFDIQWLSLFCHSICIQSLLINNLLDLTIFKITVSSYYFCFLTSTVTKKRQRGLRSLLSS